MAPKSGNMLIACRIEERKAGITCCVENRTYKTCSLLFACNFLRGANKLGLFQPGSPGSLHSHFHASHHRVVACTL